MEVVTYVGVRERMTEEDWRELGWDREIAARLARENPDMRQPHVYRVDAAGERELLEHVECHSPTGYEWGYGGSGPADLALSILCDRIGMRLVGPRGMRRLVDDARREPRARGRRPGLQVRGGRAPARGGLRAARRRRRSLGGREPGADRGDGVSGLDALAAELTPARRRGFDVLVDQQEQGRLARESNVTDAAAGYVYWQTSKWLVARELAYFPSGSTMLALTGRGRELAEHVRAAA